MNLIKENETFGQYIMRMRYLKGFTQRKLAQISGISNTTISRIEKGETTKPDLPTLKVLAQHLGIDELEIIKASGYEIYDRPIVSDRNTMPYIPYPASERTNISIEPKSEKEVPALKGVRLITLRLKRNITQKELGEILGIDKTTVSQYENQITKPDFEMLNRIARYFSVPVDYLVGKTDNPNDAAWRQQSPTATNSHRDFMSVSQNASQNSIDIASIRHEYLEVAKEMQDKRIAPEDLRTIMNIIVNNR